MPEELEPISVQCYITSEDLDTLYNKIFPSLPNPPSWTKEIVDGQPVIIVNFTEQMIESAMLSGKLIHTVAKGKLIEWIESTSEWRTTGIMGQLACGFYFYGDWREAFKYLTVGEPDRGDLQLGNFIINVITRAKLFKDENYAIIDERRFKENPYPLYIACAQVKDKIIIWGYAWFNEVQQWDIGSFNKRPPALYYPLNKLHPVEELKCLIPQSA